MQNKWTVRRDGPRGFKTFKIFFPLKDLLELKNVKEGGNDRLERHDEHVALQKQRN